MKVKCLAGLVFSCVAVLAFPSVGLSQGLELLVDGGFENATPIGAGSPLDVGYWSGDISAKVPTTDGITPLEGTSMIKFIHAASYITTDPRDDHTWAQVWQLIDLSAYNSVISAGGTTATFSGYYNRVHLGSQTDTRFVVSVYAYDGEPCNFYIEDAEDPNKPVSLGSAGTNLYTDSDLGTWEFATAELTLSVNTDFVAVCTIAVENVYCDPGDGTVAEYDGHYCDGMSLEFVPEPATLSLLAIGGLALIRRKKR